MSEDIVRVAVSGASGRMGQEVVRTVLGQPDMRLTAAIDAVHVGSDAARLSGAAECGVRVCDDPAAVQGADVLVDFSRGDVAPGLLAAAISHGVACVVGTTAIAAEALTQVDASARAHGVPVLLAPNFALGAVLMMRFSQEAARYYEWAEIIETHHENKIDAPSGTALRTAELIGAVRESARVAHETEKIAGARGASHEGVRIHAVRLPGRVAHQEVMFGGTGETLTIRHDSLSRTSFMPGVMLAVRRIRGAAPGLMVGLETLMV